MTAPPNRARIATLDIVRGVAVMGILAMNIVAFAMPFQAYMNPVAYGTESRPTSSPGSFNFIFVDGKMRGLFSFLFGASMLLVIERAEASGRHRRRASITAECSGCSCSACSTSTSSGSATSCRLRADRDGRLFLPQARPRTLIDWGDRPGPRPNRLLIGWRSTSSLAAHAAADPAPSADRPAMAEMQQGIGALHRPELAEQAGAVRGAYSGLVAPSADRAWARAARGSCIFGWETLAYMLFGMAALKTGFLPASGRWRATARWR